MSSDIVVVPHTHWDREWYLPFQRLRMGLVRVLDDVLAAMDDDPLFRFTMDGQLAAVEDYLEIRPERRADIARSAAEGRLAIGPWLILADEFLCSGETLIRNLEYGMRGSLDLGGVMRVGYLPDQFGHCAQMPQILSLAGLRHACLWRGVPAEVGRDAFAWTGADGTTIRTQYLPGGYGNAAALFGGPPEGMPDRVAAFTAGMRPWRPEGPMLAMYGADHSAPAPEITAAGLRIATLGEYLATAVPPDEDHLDGLPEVRGELRSHARANILPGVVSARIPLKRAMARAERVIARYAEPLSTLWLADRTASARLLDMAWRRVIACSGHDSITGCGADETAHQVSARIAEAEQMGQAVVDLVSASLATSASKDSVVVVNPSPFERTAIVPADLPENRAHLVTSSGAGVPVQRLDHAPTLLDETLMDDLTRLLGRTHERELSGHEIVSWTVEDGLFTIVVSRHASGGFAYEDLREAILEAGPGPWRVRTLAEPVVTVAAQVTVPPLGRSVLTARAARGQVPLTRTPEAAAALTAPEGTLDNGLLRVTVADDGTLSLRGRGGVEIHGIGRIAHAGDAGDTYNYAPPPADRLVDGPSFVKVEEIFSGPLVSVLEISRMYEWPAEAVPAEWPGDAVPAGWPEARDAAPSPASAPAETSPGSVSVTARSPLAEPEWEAGPEPKWERESGPEPEPEWESGPDWESGSKPEWGPGSGSGFGSATVNTLVTTRVELRAGEPFVRCELRFDVRCRDHRIRWHAPLPHEATESFAEGQLAVVRRGLTAEGGCGEEPVPTFPAESFVAAGGLAVLLDHVTEYELINAPEPELALTLVRSVGYLSRDRNAHRDEPAGPQHATPAAQCQGPHSTRFAVLPFAGSWHEAGLPRLAEEYRHDLLAVPGAEPAVPEPAPAAPDTGTVAPPTQATQDTRTAAPPTQAAVEARTVAPLTRGATEATETATETAAEYTRGGTAMSRVLRPESEIAISGDGVMMAALRERDGWLEVRLVAEHPVATEAVVHGDFTAARRADAFGSPAAPLEVSDGSVRLPLRPFEIATVQLRG